MRLIKILICINLHNCSPVLFSLQTSSLCTSEHSIEHLYVPCGCHSYCIIQEIIPHMIWPTFHMNLYFQKKKPTSLDCLPDISFKTKVRFALYFHRSIYISSIVLKLGQLLMDKIQLGRLVYMLVQVLKECNPRLSENNAES